MKNLNLSISDSCSENWNEFIATHNGSFCKSCNKEVIDFTKMSDAEIVSHFSKNTNPTCGRFQSRQLEFYPSLTSAFIFPGVKLLRTGLLALVIGLVGQPLFANPKHEKPNQTPFHHMITVDSEYLINGVIKSEDGLVMPGVNIYLKNGTEGTVSDENGKFEFPIKLKSGDVLVFSFIGYEKVEYIVSGELKESLEITMIFDPGMIMGKVAVDEVYTAPTHGIQKLWLKVKSVF